MRNWSLVQLIFRQLTFFSLLMPLKTGETWPRSLSGSKPTRGRLYRKSKTRARNSGTSRARSSFAKPRAEADTRRQLATSSPEKFCSSINLWPRFWPEPGGPRTAATAAGRSATPSCQAPWRVTSSFAGFDAASAQWSLDMFRRASTTSGKKLNYHYFNIVLGQRLYNSGRACVCGSKLLRSWVQFPLAAGLFSSLSVPQ